MIQLIGGGVSCFSASWPCRFRDWPQPRFKPRLLAKDHFIRPAGRTPHIHVKVLVDNRQRLATQFYLPGHPGNENDWLYQRVPQARRELVTMSFIPSEQVPQAILDIVI